MRASEQQVVELTRKLGQMEMERARLASRARLLEQVGGTGWGEGGGRGYRDERRVREGPVTSIAGRERGKQYNPMACSVCRVSEFDQLPSFYRQPCTGKLSLSASPMHTLL
jgi:hypothetical protein